MSIERINIALSTTDKLIMDNRYIGDPDNVFNENNPFLEMLSDVKRNIQHVTPSTSTWLLDSTPTLTSLFRE